MRLFLTSHQESRPSGGMKAAGKCEEFENLPSQCTCQKLDQNIENQWEQLRIR